MKGVIPLLEIDKIIKNAGAERIDERASVKLGQLLEDNAKELLGLAKVYARHAGRKQISRKDVLLAAEYLLKDRP